MRTDTRIEPTITVPSETTPEPDEPVYDPSRRHALSKLAGLTLASLAAPAAFARGGPLPGVSQLPAVPEARPDEDPLITMMRDLQRALKKPEAQRRWVMVIDLRKCVGCHACTVGCIAENKLPPGVIYRPVSEEESGVYPNVMRRFLPRLCNHCDNPPCVKPCPVKATWKAKDGLVHIDYVKCIGCGKCVEACPYDARTLDMGENWTDGTPQNQIYERAGNYEYGKKWPRTAETPPIFKARKCHFCMHRHRQGMLPMCVSTCIGRATFFGDANDPESLVAKLVSRPNLMRLKEKLGTKPRVYYIT